MSDLPIHQFSPHVSTIHQFSLSPRTYPPSTKRSAQHSLFTISRHARIHHPPILALAVRVSTIHQEKRATFLVHQFSPCTYPPSTKVACSAIRRRRQPPPPHPSLALSLALSLSLSPSRQLGPRGQPQLRRCTKDPRVWIWAAAAPFAGDVTPPHSFSLPLSLSLSLSPSLPLSLAPSTHSCASAIRSRGIWLPWEITRAWLSLITLTLDIDSTGQKSHCLSALCHS